MSRTFRKDIYTNKKVSDGKHQWRCKCERCLSLKKKKLLEKFKDEEIQAHISTG